MKPTTLLAAAALLAAAPLSIGPARAQAVSLHVRSAGDLAEMCGASPNEPTGAARLNYCSGFAQGVVDLDLRHAGGKKPFCFPPDIKREVTLHEFASWVRAVPSRGSEEATSELLRYLAERYPCK
jgi:hypothetical protein